MKNKLLLVCLGTCFGLVVAWQSGCGDPNPRGVVVVGGGSGGATVGTGGAASGSGGTAPGTGGSIAGTGGASASGGITGQGGATPGTGGSAGGGTPGHGGTAAGSGGTMGAGGANPGGMTGSAGGTGSDVIDDFDDGDGRISMTGGRQGPWHSFNDSSGGNQQPSVNGPFAPQAGGVNGSPYAAHTTGSGYQFGGIGFDLGNETTTPESMQSQSYNASAYKGITFWAKGNGNLRVEFSQKSFVPTQYGGSCNDSTTACWNVYGSRSAQGTLSLTDWKQVTITFSSLERQDGTKTPAFDPSQLMGIAFKHEGSTFDFWIDDVEFMK